MALTIDRESQGNDSHPSFLRTPPSISLPKGGGAIQGIGEKFTANPVTGTGSLSVPIFVSPGRSGFGPQLALSYDSGAGNSAFGFGWSVSLPAITRKTDKGLPQYDDLEETDVFILSGAEDLVPVLVKPNWEPEQVPPRTVANQTYRIQRYRPRVEGLFARIERWTNTDNSHDCFWRSISKDNVTTWYGRTEESRIFDPQEPRHIFSWLICQTHDDKGNVIEYRYQAEDGENVDLTLAHERNRGQKTDQARSVNRYLKRIFYGNRRPYLPKLAAANDAWPSPPNPDQPDRADHWMFEVVFDYGEGHYTSGQRNAEGYEVVEATPQSLNKWEVRNDPFSSYRAGFEVRTYRLCRRVLMFHHFPGEEDVDIECLVRSTDFNYSFTENPQDSRNPVFSFLRSINGSGYRRQGTKYLKRSLPPVRFEYTQPVIDDEIHEVDDESLKNLPYGLDFANYQWIDLDGEGLSGTLTEQAGAFFYKRNLSPINDIPGEESATRAANKAEVALKLGVREVIPSQPAPVSAGTRYQFLDLAGDGQLDLVELQNAVAGFYERTHEGGWERFRLFDSIPIVDWNNPNLRFIDLTGDGHADILISENEVFSWCASFAEAGFGEQQQVRKMLDEEKGPAVVFANSTESIFLSDFSGDGLTDIVRIRNGEVCYWPNLGYGRFGPKVTMDHAPWFDAPDLFDGSRIRLADIDGSGVTDIIYLASDGVQFYYNQSGNSWGAKNTLSKFPRVDELSTVAALDLLGNGTACLVWSSPLPSHSGRAMRYINLMGGEKPHLLISTSNNLGATTRVQYAPSTRFYLQDKEAGNPWITRLPFPVQCVESVSVHDQWRNTVFTTTYTYHHGYFDGVEREFRGFGRVEQVDTERFGKFAKGNAESPYITNDKILYQPPVKTVTWFHTGAFIDGGEVLSHYKDEYFPRWFEDLRPNETNILGTFKENDLPEPDLNERDLASEEWREALRACKGMPLRQEIYELDVDALETGEHRPVKLFSTSYHNCRIERVQPQKTNKHAVFLVTESEAITYHYELDLESRNVTPAPRIVHTLNLRFDEYGRVVQSVAIGYRRRSQENDPSLNADQVELIREIQGEQHVSYTETHFTDELAADPDVHRLPAPCEVLTYEITGIEPTNQVNNPYFSIDKLRDYRFNDDLDQQAMESVLELAYHQQPPDETPHKRLVEHLITLYFNDDLSDKLAFGVPSRLGLIYESYKLALTETLLEKILGPKFDNATRIALDRQAINPDFLVSGYQRGETLLGNKGAGQWWMRSGVVGFATDAADHFYLPERYIDPFGQVTRVEFDTKYDLFLKLQQDAAGNTVTVAKFDYRVLTPTKVIDANANVSEAAFDTLGLPIASALAGKEDDPSGDSVAGLTLDPPVSEIKDFFTNDYSATNPVSWLQQATVRYVYDMGEDLGPNGVVTYGNRPVAACGIMREGHVNAGDEIKIQVGVEYSDGMGTVLVKKSQAEPDPTDPQNTALRWIASGKTILNNKGKPVKQYEPYFSQAEHRFDKTEAEREVGVTPIMYYDAAGRLLRTEMPDGSFSRIEFTPWRILTYDANDTAFNDDLAERSDWYNRRKDPAHARFAEFNSTQNVRAADLVELHADTPTLTILDSLGREVIGVTHNRFKDPAGVIKNEKYLTFTKLDAEGKPLWIRDALGHLVMQYITPPKMNNDPSNAVPPNAVACYDIAGNLLFQHSMDAGDRWMMMDAAGNPMRAWDRNERQVEAIFVPEDRTYSTDFDVLHRPTAQWLSIDGNPRQMVERFEYRDARNNDAAALQNNLHGELVRHYDTSGMVETVRRDFKGNTLQVNRRLTNQPTASLTDWQTSPDNFLDAETFTQITEFDALNRITKHYNWHRGGGSLVAIYEPLYNERGILKSETLRVRAEKKVTGADETRSRLEDAIKEIRYDEKGQKTYIELGNGTLTEYQYDPETFRLIQIFTTRPGQQRPYANRKSELQDPRVIQELNYTYDPVGNITEIEDEAYKPVFFSNAIVEPRSLYEYDSLYRLISASGRENGSLTGPPANREGNSPEANFPVPSSNALRRYTQTYAYDPVGNIKMMRHEAPLVAGVSGGWTREYAYAFEDTTQPVSNRLWQTWTGGDRTAAITYEHDTHGNMLNLQRTAPRFNLRWDHRDMIASIDLGGGGIAYYQYDASKQRTRKRIEKQNGSTGFWERIYLGGYELYRRYNGDGSAPVEEIESHHLFAGDERVLLVDDIVIASDTTHPRPDTLLVAAQTLFRYQYGNHLGSACLELDDEAGIISYEEFHPYGTGAYRALRRGIDVPPKRYRYTGMERDEESGMSRHGARSYSPDLARWVSSDPSGMTDGPNLYRYAGCNPVCATDTTGSATLPKTNLSGFAKSGKYQLLETKVGFTREHLIAGRQFYWTLMETYGPTPAGRAAVQKIAGRLYANQETVQTNNEISKPKTKLDNARSREMRTAVKSGEPIPHSEDMYLRSIRDTVNSAKAEGFPVSADDVADLKSGARKQVASAIKAEGLIQAELNGTASIPSGPIAKQLEPTAPPAPAVPEPANKVNVTRFPKGATAGEPTLYGFAGMVLPAVPSLLADARDEKIAATVAKSTVPTFNDALGTFEIVSRSKGLIRQTLDFFFSPFDNSDIEYGKRYVSGPIKDQVIMLDLLEAQPYLKSIKEQTGHWDLFGNFVRGAKSKTYYLTEEQQYFDEQRRSQY